MKKIDNKKIIDNENCSIFKATAITSFSKAGS